MGIFLRSVGVNLVATVAYLGSISASEIYEKSEIMDFTNLITSGSMGLYRPFLSRRVSSKIPFLKRVAICYDLCLKKERKWKGL